MINKESIEASAIETIFGGASGLERVGDLDFSSTRSPGPDKIGAIVVSRFVDGVMMTCWSVVGTFEDVTYDDFETRD